MHQQVQRLLALNLPGPAVTGSCEAPDVGSGDWTSLNCWAWETNFQEGWSTVFTTRLKHWPSIIWYLDPTFLSDSPFLSFSRCPSTFIYLPICGLGQGTMTGEIDCCLQSQRHCSFALIVHLKSWSKPVCRNQLICMACLRVSITVLNVTRKVSTTLFETGFQAGICHIDRNSWLSSSSSRGSVLKVKSRYDTSPL